MNNISVFEGTIKKIGATQVISEKFAKREFVLSSGDKFPQHVQFEMIQEGCERLDSFKVGDLVKVVYSLKGREWMNANGEVKYFNTLQVSMVSHLSAEDKKSESFQQRTGQELIKKAKPLGNIEQNFQEEAIRDIENDYYDENDGLPF